METPFKKVIVLVAILMNSFLLMSQDIIVTNDAKKIEAKVIEVSKTEIKYKAADNPNGPLYVMEIRDINCIIYANGKVELYQHLSEILQKANLDSILDVTIAKANAIGALFEETYSRTSEAVARAKAQGLYSSTPKKGNDEKNVKATAMGTLFGNPVGRGCSSWSLSGRNLIGPLPQPSNDFNQEGRVIVEIRVNEEGYVVSASVKGGTISDRRTQKLAVEAAKKAKFTSGSHDQIGTITYNFRFE